MVGSHHVCFSKSLISGALFVGVILICSSSVSFGQVPVPTPDYVPPVSFSEILKGLGDESVHSYFDRNREMIQAIYDRGVGFGFGTSAKDVLKKAGASEGLIEVITNAEKKRSDDILRLYKEYVESKNKFGIEDQRKRIALARALLDKIGDPELLVGDERELSGIVKRLAENLPKMEAELKQILASKNEYLP